MERVVKFENYFAFCIKYNYKALGKFRMSSVFHDAFWTVGWGGRYGFD